MLFLFNCQTRIKIAYFYHKRVNYEKEGQTQSFVLRNELYSGFYNIVETLEFFLLFLLFFLIPSLIA